MKRWRRASSSTAGEQSETDGTEASPARSTARTGMVQLRTTLSEADIDAIRARWRETALTSSGRLRASQAFLLSEPARWSYAGPRASYTWPRKSGRARLASLLARTSRAGTSSAGDTARADASSSLTASCSKGMRMTTADIRAELVEQYELNPFQPMVEIKGASFIADKPAIIGTPNQEYIRHELDWYESQSLNINDIPGGAPKMWRRTANEAGQINSNYGWVLWSEENGLQFNHIVKELRRDYASRRALAIYTRPSMHIDQSLGGGGQDFMCTNAVAYSINPEQQQLDVVVQMRSNDVVFGYRNDYAWQVYAANYIIADLQQDWPALHLGKIYWQAQSLHVYPRHYSLLRSAARGKMDEVVHDGEV